MSDVIKRLTEYVTEECSKVDMERRYDDMLDEIYSFKDVGGIFAHMQPSRVLKEMDPVAYRCGMNDWEDSEGLVEINGDYYESDDVDEAKTKFIDDLESELSNLEKELDELIDPLDDDGDRLKEEISNLEAAIKECEEYVF